MVQEIDLAVGKRQFAPFQDFGLPFRNHPFTKEPMRIYHDGNERQVLNSNIRKFNDQFSCYLGIYVFEREPEGFEDKENAIIFDKVAFDFDAEVKDKLNVQPEELEAVREDYLRLKKKFCDPMGIIPIVEFTGGKGLQVFLYFPRINIKNVKKTLKYVQQKIATQCGLTTSDPQIYGDISRIMRIPNTKYIKEKKWSGRYCIPLYHDDLEKHDFQRIIEMSSEPRRINQTRNYSVELKRFVLQASREVEIKAAERKAEYRERRRANPGPNMIGGNHISYYCKSASDVLMSGAGQGKRDQYLVGLINWLKHIGESEDQIRETVMDWGMSCSPPLLPSYIEEKIKYHMNRDYWYCTFLRDNAGCSEECRKALGLVNEDD